MARPHEGHLHGGQSLLPVLRVGGDINEETTGTPSTRPVPVAVVDPIEPRC